MFDASSLPTEIVARIAEELYYDDVRSFALTCRSWLSGAEQHIWKELDLATDDITDSIAANVDVNNEDGQDKSQLKSEIESNLLGRQQRVLEAIKRRPERAKMIRYIDFAVIASALDIQRQLIELSHKALLEVTFQCPPASPPRSSSLDQELYAVFAECPVLERVQAAGFCLSENWDGQMRHIVRLCPNVAQLSLRFLADPDKVDTDDKEWLHLPSLQHLVVRNDLSIPSTYLQLVLEHNRDIKTLRCELESDAHLQLRNMDAETATALREYKSITRLDWCLRGLSFSNTRDLFNGTGFENLEYSTFDASIYSESETYLETIAISCRRANWHRSTRAPGWATVPPPRGFVIPTTVAQLKNCPSLTTVHFCCFGVDPDPNPLKWCSKRTNGVLIRTYTNGIDEFVHLRRLELLKVNPKLYEAYEPDEMDECNGSDHRWVDQTSYKGIRVLDDVLEQVYKAAGAHKQDWLEPGRGMTLPDKAWRALERGYKKARKMPQW